MKRLLYVLCGSITIFALAACNLPGWSTYTNGAYGFRLQYPPTGSIAPGGTAVAARIDLPITPGTNLVEKYLEISVITDGSPCVSPHSLGYAPGSLTPTTLTINGLTFVRENAGEGAAGSIYEWVAYSTVSGSVCVNLTFILHSHNPGVYLPTVVPTYAPSENDVFLQIVETFAWLTGSATTPTAVGGTASISGNLWYDQCPIPLDISPVPSPLPAGCVSDSYGVDADGIHQPGEPFMTGITVNIGPGDCPVGGPLSTVTDGSGNYSFTGLTPGNYCINVNAASFLGPGGVGHWTVIPSGHEGNTYRAITLSAGEVLTGQDFAWYQYSGPTPTAVPSSTFTPTPAASFTPTPVAAGLFFIPNINLNCHFGPGLFYDTLDVALKGTSYPIDGRNATGDWLRIMLDPNKGCWVLTKDGQPSGDTSGVRVLIAPPTPTPTPVPVDCAQYTSKSSCSAIPQCVWTPLNDRTGLCSKK